MKIAFFTPTLNFGGYEKVVVSYANYLSKQDHDIYIVCGDSSGKLKEQISKQVKVLSLHCRTKNLLPRLIKLFLNYDFDIFYSGFRVYNSISVISKIISKNTKVKIIISQHGYEYQNIFIRKVHSLLQKKADGFVAVTEGLLVYETKSLGLICPSKVVGNPVIGNIISSDKIHGSWFDSDKIICVCGRLSKDKNIDLAIHILKKLHDTSYHCKLLILGDGPEKKYLEELAESYSLNDYVRFEGYVTNPIDYMKQCNVYLHTCRREGFGNTVVEAMYANLPIVTTDCGGPVDIIEGNKYGICIGPSDSKYVILNGMNAIKKILDNKISFKNMREKSLNFTLRPTSKELETFFIDILNVNH